MRQLAPKSQPVNSLAWIPSPTLDAAACSQLFIGLEVLYLVNTK